MNSLTVKDTFRFEEDFVEKNIRCIPMVVRFKLDMCGIKLKLAEWSRMTMREKESLANFPCEMPEEILEYRNYLERLVFNLTGNYATGLPVMENPVWAQVDEIPYTITEKLREFNWSLNIQQWGSLSDLQRFALLKLSYPGHENKNFPKAMLEFGLT